MRLLLLVMLAVLLSFLTAYSTTFITVRVYVYFVGDVLDQGFTAGVGYIIIALYSFPITFLTALLIWVDDNRPRSPVVKEVGGWLGSLLVSLGISTLITLGLTYLILTLQGWKVTSDGADGGMLYVWGIGFPALSLVIYAAALRRVFRGHLKGIN